MALPKWLQLVEVFAPMVLAAAGVPTSILLPITSAIAEAEQIPGASGPNKKAHVLNITKFAIELANIKHGSQVLDPLRVVAAVDEGIDLAVETIDLVHDATVEPNQLNAPTPESQPTIPPSTAAVAQEDAPAEMPSEKAKPSKKVK